MRQNAAARRSDLVRALGIDFGEKRIGLAVSDPEGRLAVPLTTLARRDDRSAMAEIAEIARREGIGRLVVGEPVGLDGRRGPAAARVRRFGERLAARTALPLTFVGEALTSVEAAARLRAAGVDLRREPERIDAAAAQILLQEDLDRERERGGGRGHGRGLEPDPEHGPGGQR
jgi:putative holliday junction resolvase